MIVRYEQLSGYQLDSKTAQASIAAATVPPLDREKAASPVPRATTPNIRDDSERILRILLLGPAESGKTTLLEQIRIIHKQTFTEAELFHKRVVIYATILSSLQRLIQYVHEEGGKMSTEENAHYAENLLLEEVHYSRFTEEQVKAISSVWHDPIVQDAYTRRSAVNLNDSTKFFLDELPRINSVDYMPTPEDMIMNYVPTVGVQNVIFTVNNRTFQLFDIGGQKIDRRKWATMYDGIDAIFYCLAISEYDQVMMEDMKTNRLEDSLALLEKIAHEEKFANTPLMLFLNEVDVFTQKLSVFPLDDFIPDYAGRTPEDALNFIEEMARMRVGRTDKNLFRVYRTVMIDTPKMTKILTEIFKKQLR